MATPPLSDPEWKRVPATYTDVFDLAVIQEIKLVRIAFSEAMGRGHSPIVRTAIMMPMSDAKELVRLLGELIAEAEAQETKEAQPALTLKKL